MDRDELISAVSEDLFAYVMHGEIAEAQIATQLKPTGLDERFESFDALVDLHFLLRPPVVNFVEKLPTHIRSVKTQTKNVQQTTRGGINGRIDWPSTVKRRCSSAPGDRSLFVCDNRHESYDIDENIVLKRLLSVIYTTLGECEVYLQQEYDWVTDQWQDNLALVEQMRELFERNVHVTRIREPKAYEPTERMLQTAQLSRNKVYRDAATLLQEYQQVRENDPKALRELLEETLITPDDEETLFELYVLFRYVQAIEEHQESKTTIKTIESGRQEVARIESDTGTDVVLYHDNSASDRNLSFIPEPIEKPDAILTRSEQIQRQAREIVSSYFTDKRFDLRTNRPDIIILEVRHEDARKYLITEVKNSTNENTIKQGVTETLEYLAFLRQENQLVFADDTPFGSGWNGVLVVQDFADRQTAALEEQDTIKVIQASELSEFLPAVLDRLL